MTGHSAGRDAPSIAVVGVGGVGGYFGACLARAGLDVRLLARGQNLAALRHGGLRITGSGETWSARTVPAADEPREIGTVDVVLLCVKTFQLPSVIDRLNPLLGAGTAVVTVQNGVEAPEQVAAALGRERVLPGLARIAATLVGPGVVEHAGGPVALSFSEWDGAASARVSGLRAALHAGGISAPEPSDIWAELWTRFMTVVPIGSLGAATGGATVGELRSRAGTRRLAVAAMREIYQIGRALGIALPTDAVDSAVAVMDQQPAQLTTSLQRDILADRPSELEAWIGSVVRLAGRAGQGAPVHEMLYELLATRVSRTAGASETPRYEKAGAAR